MKKKVLLLAALFAGMMGTAQAQHYKCGTDLELNKLLEKNPKLLQQLEAQRQHELQRNGYSVAADEDSTLIIPVAIHVIHNYGAENVSMAQIEDAIRIINEDFKLMNSDTSEVLPAFKSRIGNPRIEFRLAKKDPFGNCTMGVTRTVSTLTNSADNDVKNLVGWGTRYLNIWIVSNIASGAGAYAHYPGSVQASYEGIVCRASQFGSIGASSPNNFSSRTLTHEIGHYLNLPHTWGSSNEPGLASNCNIDDGVTDTPNTIGVSVQNCIKNMPGCVAGELTNVENYMDYSSCARMYTKGQVTRMRNAMASSIGGRSGLWSLANRIATGTNNGYVSPLCAPKPDFTSSAKQTCMDRPVGYTASAYNVVADSIANVKYRWVLTGATPSTAEGAQVQVSYANAGVFPVRLIARNSAGKDSITKTSYITVLSSSAAYSATLGTTEGFELNTFPNFAGNTGKNWQIANGANSGWGRSTIAKKTGAASVRIDNRSIAVPDLTVSTLTSSGFDLTTIAQPVYLSFQMAFARTATANRDELKVQVSTDCGRTWSQALYKKTAISPTSPLSTIGTTLVASNTTFVPTATQWRRELVNLNNYAGQNNLRIRFEMTSRGGNNLYLDDIMVLQDPTVGLAENLQKFEVNVYPNPYEDAAQVDYTLTQSENVSAFMTDVLGREVWAAPTQMQEAAQHTLALPTNLAKGMYILHLQIGDRKMAQKIVKQ
jgi:PKD repeat protein